MILNVHTRLIRNIHESIITFTGEDKMANVKIEEEVWAQLLKLWFINQKFR